MTDIPDDVVERARQIIWRDFAGYANEESLRAAGRVFVEWERERIYSLIGQYLGQEDLLDYLRSRNLPASNPDEGNPSDYT
jgi:hypothetical protein